MAMWRRGAKLESASSYFLREWGDLLCFSCRSYSTNMRPVVHLHNSITKAELFLVGVDHVSPKSAEFVRHVIRDLTPNVVAVELCQGRGKVLLSSQPRKPMTLNEIYALKGSLREKTLQFFMNKQYAGVAATGLNPGDELRAAIEEGLAFGADIVYMDRAMNVTLKRTAQEFSLMELLWFILKRKEISRKYPVIFKAFSIDDPDQYAEAIMHPKAQEEAMDFGEKYFPGLAKSLVHERNEYMVKKLRNLSGNVVGVVGALHLQGMQKLWQEAEGEARG